MKVSGQILAPAALLRRIKNTRTHRIGGWVDPKVGLDTVAKGKVPSPCRESNPDLSTLRLVTIPTELSRLLTMEGEERLILGSFNGAL
jgi:hypothetical protein